MDFRGECSQRAKRWGRGLRHASYRVPTALGSSLSGNARACSPSACRGRRAYMPAVQRSALRTMLLAWLVQRGEVTAGSSTKRARRRCGDSEQHHPGGARPGMANTEAAFGRVVQRADSGRPTRKPQVGQSTLFGAVVLVRVYNCIMFSDIRRHTSAMVAAGAPGSALVRSGRGE